MDIVKKISSYKLISIVLFLITSVTTLICYQLLSSPCPEIANGIDCLYDKKFALYQPVYFGGRVFALLLFSLLLIPPHIFRKWLFYIATPLIALIVFLVQDISVYSSGVLSISRAKMAENGMIVLAIITVVFVVAHIIYDWKKKQYIVK